MKNTLLKQKMLKVIVSATFCLIFSGLAFAQQRMSGKVLDSSGQPVIGAAVFVKGTTNGTTTDLDGCWTLSVKLGEVLSFESIGYTSREITLKPGDPSEIVITLTESSEFLDDVVVIGYGTMEKKMVTSSVSSINGDVIRPGAGDASVAMALRGKVGGLTVVGTDSPNSGTAMQLRGMASVNAGMSPLVVIDGMPGGDIRSVLPEDILSIDVLKDASAGAIYGTRAAAGVILITTRNADRMNEGSVRLTYSGEVSHKTVQKRPDVLGADEYLELRASEGAIDYGSSFDWYDAMINKDNFSQKHTITAQAKSKFASVYGTFQYNDNQGIAIMDSRTDYAGRLNANFNLLKGWLDLGARVAYRQANRNDNAPDFAQAIRNNPTRSAYDPESITGYNVWQNETLEYNTIADHALIDYDGVDTWFIPEVSAKLNVLCVPGLSYTQNVGIERRSWRLLQFRNENHRTELDNNRKGTASMETSTTNILNAEGFANYAKSVADHKFEATAGYSYYERNREAFDMQNADFTFQGVKYWDMGSGSYMNSGQARLGSHKDITQRLLAYFGRINYSYSNKYIASASIRRECSSKFAENNRWGTFWSVSGGWRISSERFMESTKTWLDDLKLRVAYGVTGNNNFSDSYGAAAYADDGYFMMPNSGKYALVYGPSINLNPNLKWEEQHGFNVGVDYSFFNRRLYGKFDWYNRKVVDMLYEVQCSQPPFAKQTMMANIGSMRNRGWEFEIGGDIVRTPKFVYSTNLILSHENTQILTLFGNDTFYTFAELPAPGSPGDAIRIEEGTTIGSFYMLKCAGIDEATGEFLIYRPNYDESGKACEPDVIYGSEALASDKQYTGNYIPKLTASWSHKISYGNFDFSMDLRSWIKFDVLNTLDMYYGLRSQQGTNALRSAYGKNAAITVEKMLCDYFLEDGTFLKIDAINLGYTIPMKKVTSAFIDSIRVYANVNNVCTLTKYSGMDPEVNITGFDGGIEWWNSSFYPRTRGFVLGAQITF